MQTSQRLEMTLSPQMIQSMEFLQMPQMQLEQRIRQEQLENPTLEIEELEDLEGETATESLAPDSIEAEAAGEAAEPAASDYSDNDPAEGLERIDEIDCDWDDVYSDYAPARGSSADDDEAYDPVATAAARQPSLVEHLLAQLAEMPMPAARRRLAEAIVGKLDHNGWLTVPLEETVPDGAAPPPAAAELAAALAEVQSLDPDGIGARDLSECLLLQLRSRADGSLARAVVRDHLEDLAANRLPKIARDLRVEVGDVKSALEMIRSLNPRPGADYAPEPVPLVKPELIIDGDAEAGFTVRLASGAQPAVSDFFTALFDSSRRGKIVRERLETDPAQAAAFHDFKSQMRRTGLAKRFREKYNNALWLVKAVAQRERTILTVATEIVKAQDDYLARRTAAPAPLFMQDIADKIGYDISTVSRAVKDKYIDTPQGIKPLKAFFARASGTADGGGDVNSSAGVLLRIQRMLEAEDKRRPLRDNEIMERLAAEGIHIKRRSIVNYREKLGYASHSHRKEH